MPRPIDITYSPVAISTTKVAAGQTLGGAGNMTLAAAASNLDYARKITLTCAGFDESGVSFTITGTDADGRAATEVLVGPNSNTVTSVNYYKSITTIAANGAVAHSTSAGTSNQFAGAMLPLNFYRRVPHTVDVEATGTITFTIQETFDQVLNGETALWQNQPSLTNVVVSSSVPAGVNQQGTLNASALRVISNSYTTGATLKLLVIQSAGTEDD